MTRSSDLVMVEREPTEAMLNAAHDWSMAKYGIGIGNDAAAECWQAMIAAALQSVEGGVQGRIATKQESCPESAPRTETADENFAQLVTARDVAKSAYAKGVDMSIWQADVRALDWAVEFIGAQLTKTPSADHDAGNLPSDRPHDLLFSKFGSLLDGFCRSVDRLRQISDQDAPPILLTNEIDLIESRIAAIRSLLPAPPSPESTPRDSSESTTGGDAPDHTTMEERG